MTSSAPDARRVRARLNPINPKPPVISTRRFAKSLASAGGISTPRPFPLFVKVLSMVLGMALIDVLPGLLRLAKQSVHDSYLRNSQFDSMVADAGPKKEGRTQVPKKKGGRRVRLIQSRRIDQFKMHE